MAQILKEQVQKIGTKGKKGTKDSDNRMEAFDGEEAA